MVQRVVVIGAGDSGVAAAQYLYDHLPKEYSVTIIDRREFHYHLPGGVRANIAPTPATESKKENESWPQSICVPLTGVFKKCKYQPSGDQVRGEVILGEVTAMNSATQLTYKDIATNEQKQLDYDYAVHFVLSTFYYCLSSCKRSSHRAQSGLRR